MKNYKKKITIILLIALLGGSVQAKVRAVMTRRDFERSVSKDSMVVALFYEDQKGNNDVRDQNRGLIRMYEDLSAYRPYDDADVIFLKVNVGRKDLADLAALYGIKTVPTIIFFNNGQRLADAQEMPVMVTGFVPRTDVQSIIDQYYGQEVQKRVENKEERRKEIVKEESESWKLYFYPRYSVVRDYDPSERDME